MTNEDLPPHVGSFDWWKERAEFYEKRCSRQESRCENYCLEIIKAQQQVIKE